MSAAQLSFPASQVAKLAALDGVEDAAGSLTLSARSVSGDRAGGRLRAHAGCARSRRRRSRRRSGRRSTSSRSASPASTRPSPRLAAIGAGQITNGRTLRSGQRPRGGAERPPTRAATASRWGDHQAQGQEFTVVGLARSPLGGQSSDAYVKLAQLQAISDRKGRVNSAQVRATSTEDVAAVEKRDQRDALPALGHHRLGPRRSRRRLAGRRQEPVGKLGTALTIVGLAAAFLIASLLTLSSVTKRIRELGTLKAIGWPGRHVVRQVTGESLVQGALGGVFGGADRRSAARRW